MSRQKLIIIATVFVDVLGFSIVIPTLPYYLTEFGASPTTITLLFSVFSFCAFLSAPLLGSISDRIGRRPVLLLSIFSTSAGWFVFASAVSIPMLFIGRMIDGLAAGNFTTAQSYLVDISNNDEQERMKNLGIIGATFGIGFVIGPVVGGVLSTISHSFPFYFAGSLAFINGISAYFLLEESNHHRNTAPIRYNPLMPILRAYRNLTLRPLYIKWFLYSLSFVIVQSTFALFTQRAFSYSSFQTGILFTAIGLIIAVNQTLLLQRFWIKRFSNHQLELIMLGMSFIGLLMSATAALPMFLLALPLVGSGQAVYRVVVANEAIHRSEQTTRGEIMGTIASVMTAAMVVSPLIAGSLFEVNIIYPFLAGAAAVLAAFLLSIRTPSPGT
ncbi:MAG: MFS transporter [Bacteroidetes bacterium]|nr:MFS transporter [Bacteroidota bacterium]